MTLTLRQKDKTSSMKFREPDHIVLTSLTAAEQDLLALVLCDISKHQARKDKTKEIPTMFCYSEEFLLKLFDCNQDKLRKTLKAAGDKLTTKKCGYSNAKGFDTFTAFGRVTYSQGGDFKIEMLKSIVLMLSKYDGFSEMDFKLFLSLSTSEAKRLFREISRWKSFSRNKTKKDKFIDFKEYKKLLGINLDSYKDFKSLRRYRITPIFKDIIDKSNGLWTPTDSEGLGYKVKKTGKRTTHISFCLQYNAAAIKEEPLTGVDAYETYEKLTKGDTDITKKELLNLEERLSELIIEGVVFDVNFPANFREAKLKLENK